MPAICIQDLHYAYPPPLPQQPAEEVLRGLSLRIERGEFVALMGPTGAGKTTLCMALNGLVPQATGGVIRGRVDILGRSARAVPVAELARDVGLVFQDAESQLFCATVEDEVAFGLENLGLARSEMAERITWALRVVALEAQRHRPTAYLSGGQKQRLAIAAILAMLPQVLILDEPTAGLDPAGEAEVLRVIEWLCHERRMTVLLVSQEPEQVAQYAERVAVMHEGIVVCDDAPERVFAESEWLKAIGLAAPQVTEVAEALRRRCGRAWHFVRLDEAVEALRRDLRGGQP